MRTEIKKLHQRIEKTTIYVTHDQVEAMTLASRIAVMHQGRVQQFAEPRQVYERPANIFVAGFMGSPAMNFIPAELASVDGKPAVAVALNGSAPALLPLPAARAPSGSPGRRVILGVRPEHLSREGGERGAPRGTVGKLEAPVQVVEPTGAETIVLLRVGEREVVARFDPDFAPEVGERVPLAVNMDKACLFDAESERLL
jgi:multiple sugar transport system ATP-binding protein